jgi:aryl-alcohol dehydrogenase-like predicted oxidoreductase
MQYRFLSQTELKVSEIAFGTWPISGHGMGRVDEQEAIATIHKAIDQGITFFDTADMYGFGYAEELLARAIPPSERNGIVITTKVGMEWDDAGNLRRNLKPEYILRACEDSLRRLKTDTIDLYQIHWPDPETPFEETAEALQKLVWDGKVRYIGVSNFSVLEMERALSYLPIVSNQLEYSLIKRDIEMDIIPFCIENQISVLPYKVLGRGILTGKFNKIPVFEENDWRTKETYFQQEVFNQTSTKVTELKAVANKYNVSPGQTAIAWSLRLPIVASVIVGVKKPDQIEESCGGTGWQLQQEHIDKLSAIFAPSIQNC